MFTLTLLRGGNAPRLIVDVNQALSSTTTSNVSNGLVAHWTFDETTGNQVTDSAGSHHGTLYNMTDSAWVAGKEGNALDFGGDSSGDYVAVADSPELDLTNQLTLSAWVNGDVFGDWDGIISKGTSGISYGMDVQANGSVSFTANHSISGGVGSGDWYSNTKLSTGQWHHIAVTYDETAIRFYIDGQLDSNVVNTNLTFANSNQALILGKDFSANNILNGRIDDARVYNRALSSEEITQLIQGESQSNITTETTSSPGAGNDKLTGNGGNDTLTGGAGDDILNGTDEIVAGYYEKDILTGGDGADKFILGDANQAYYATAGHQDYAVIKDFDSTVDFLQLHGIAGDYQQQEQEDNIFLSRNGDLVAILENTSTLNLNDSAFEYVTVI